MNIIDLETPAETEKHHAPHTDDIHPLIISEYGKTFSGTPCYQLRMESHVSCIQYVVSGSGVIICNDKIYTVNKGDTFLLPEGSNQIYYSNTDNNFERLWLNFKGVLSKELMKIYRLDNVVVFRNTNSGILISETIKLLKTISNITEYKDASAVQILKIMQFLRKNTDNAADSSSESIEQIRLYIDCHITENLSLSHISAKFNFSKEHIIRLFKKNYGITPHKYIIQSKIRIAMILLQSSNYTIEEISEKLSFSDPHHFSAQFCQNLGCRPSVYRNNYIN